VLVSDAAHGMLPPLWLRRIKDWKMAAIATLSAKSALSAGLGYTEAIESAKKLLSEAHADGYIFKK